MEIRIENCFWTEGKEVNLTTLWSEKPCLFDVTLSDYGNRLKKDSAFQYNKSMSLTILSHCPTFKNASWSALGAKLWQQPTIFSLRCRHSVCLYWFAQFLNVTLWNLGWSATLSRSAKKIAKCVSSYMWRSNWLQLAHKIPKCVAGLRQKVLRTL